MRPLTQYLIDVAERKVATEQLVADIRTALRNALTSPWQSSSIYSWVMPWGTLRLKPKPGGVQSR
jgi:hypothetical protein